QVLEKRDLGRQSGGNQHQFHGVIVVWIRSAEHPSNALGIDAGVELQPVIRQLQRWPVNSDLPAGVHTAGISRPALHPAAFAHDDAGTGAVTRTCTRNGWLSRL